MSRSGLCRDRIDRRGAGATGLEAGSVGDGAFLIGELEAGVAGTYTLKPKRRRMETAVACQNAATREAHKITAVATNVGR